MWHIVGVVLFMIVGICLAWRRQPIDTLKRRLGLTQSPEAVTPYTIVDTKTASNLPATSAQLEDSFPPSQREYLAAIKSHLARPQQRELTDSKPKAELSSSSIIGWEEDYRSCNSSTFIPNGLSVAEIKALGDFPDYSLLSDFPQPSPYVAFDINKAIPRPYRPLRWAYHQTMCTRPIANV